MMRTRRAQQTLVWWMYADLCPVRRARTAVDIKRLMTNDFGAMLEDKGMKTILMKTLLAAVCVVGLLQGSATAGMAVLDNFNRADGPLGPNWTIQAGSFSIVSDEAVGSGVGIATYNGVTSNALEADVQDSASADLDYVGLVLGYADLNQNLFMKVQD
jgi:hypothetical protein